MRQEVHVKQHNSSDTSQKFYTIKVMDEDRVLRSETISEQYLETLIRYYLSQGLHISYR